MNPQQLSRFLTRLETAVPSFAGDEVDLHFGPVWSALQAKELVYPDSRSPTTLCPDCQSRVVRVEYLQLPNHDMYCHGICHDCGLVTIPRTRTQIWAVNVPAFVQAFQKAALIAGEPESVIPEHLWRLGHMRQTPSQAKEVFLALNSSKLANPAVINHLAKHDKAILWVPSSQSYYWHSVPKIAGVFRLNEFLTFDQHGFAFQADIFAQVWNGAAPTVVARQKKGSGLSKPKRRKLLKEIRKYVKDARDHAFACLDQGQPPKLLPRPTQKTLAGMTGIGESTLSRALHDPDEKEITMLWAALDDLDQVMSYQKCTRTERE